jgi:5-methylcytosine-specific restriction endonuclease McrA
MSDNSISLGLSQRALEMRKTLSANHWEKGIKTRITNGNIINWDIAEWKQYWRRCNDLTRKIRKQMLESWDGFDYIDGEYIKDNLKLHYTHGSYPTLDHVIPRSQGFKDKISPYDITKPENLKWTKRSNNSKKGFK